MKPARSRKYTCAAATMHEKPAAIRITRPTIGTASSIAHPNATPAITWITRYTGTVGRKRLKPPTTDDSGSSTRGKAVFRISLPPPTIEFVASRTEPAKSWKRNSAAVRWAKNSTPRLPPRMTITSMKYTQAIKSGVRTSQSWPSAVSKCFARSFVRDRVSANSRRRTSSRR